MAHSRLTLLLRRTHMSDDRASESLAYYASHGPVTDPALHAAAFAGLPADIRALTRAVQGLVFHYFADEKIFGWRAEGPPSRDRHTPCARDAGAAGRTGPTPARRGKAAGATPGRLLSRLHRVALRDGAPPRDPDPGPGRLRPVLYPGLPRRPRDRRVVGQRRAALAARRPRAQRAARRALSDRLRSVRRSSQPVHRRRPRLAALPDGRG